jgi:hypothetical protein
MKAKHVSLILAGLIAVVALAVAVQAWRRAREAHAARSEVERQRLAAGASLRNWQARATAAEQERERLQSALAAAAAATPSVPAGPKKPDPWERLQQDPEMQILALANERAQVLATYGALFRKLGFSPQQIAAFQEIAFRRRERMMDLQAVMKMKGLSWQDPAIQKLRGDSEAEFKAAQRSLLGEDDYKKLADYERTTWLREKIRGWAGGAVVVAREPFTPEQGERLVEIMANASESYRGGGHPDTGEPDYWARVEAGARQILSPTQFTYFATMEPPLPVGARFQTEFYARVQEALKAETDRKKTASPDSPGR